MNKNDIFRMEITGFQADGFGVGRADGMVVFVPGAAPGDVCDARIVKVLSNYAFGKIEKLITPSRAREENDCPSFPACGGCAFRHVKYEEELKWKADVVASALKRIGGVDAGEVGLIPAESTVGYRNKAVFQLGEENGRPAFGFYRTGSHRLVPAESCRIQSPAAIDAAKAFCTYMEQTGLDPGDVKCLFVRTAEQTGELLLCPVFSSKRKMDAERMKGLLPGMTSLFCNINPGGGNAVLGAETIHVWGKMHLTEKLCGLDYDVSPESFFQINRRMCEILYAKVAEFAGDVRHKKVLDLFCGIGTITLYLAKRCAEIAGVETVAAAIENAKRNAGKNGINNARFFLGDANKLPNDYAPDLIVADPPRKGLDETLIQAVAGGRCGRFIYVSCNPATLARDVKLFRASGFELKKVAAIDMFPQTGHVETVALLERG